MKYIIKVGVEVREIDSSWYQLEEYSGIIHESYEEAKKELREAKKKTKYAFMYRITDKEVNNDKLLDDILELCNYCGRKCEITHPSCMSNHETTEDYYFNKGRYRAYRDIFGELWEIIANNKEE